MIGSLGNATVSLSGEIDLSTVEQVRELLDPCVEAGGPVLLDVTHVTFIDSTGLHLLLRSAKGLGDRGCIVIHGAGPQLLRLLDIVGLTEGRHPPNLHVLPCSTLEAADPESPAPNGRVGRSPVAHGQGS